MSEQRTMVEAKSLTKRFVLHTRGGIEIDVFNDLSLSVYPGECLILAGPSGVGKSSLLRCIYANYLPQSGQVLVRHDGEMIDMTKATPFQISAVRRKTMGYVSQFLRVIPRVTTIDLVAEPLLNRGALPDEAREKSAALLSRLRLPERLWQVPPATFSGGEQQRVNIARSFIADYPILLLDEPTASLDSENRKTVIDLIVEARNRGRAVLGIFHDEDVREAVGTSTFDLVDLEKRRH